MGAIHNKHVDLATVHKKVATFQGSILIVVVVIVVVIKWILNQMRTQINAYTKMNFSGCSITTAGGAQKLSPPTNKHMIKVQSWNC